MSAAITYPQAADHRKAEVTNPRPPQRGRPRLRMLLSSAGRRVALLRCFRSSAAALGIDLDVFACDQKPEWSSACYEADYAFAVPPVTSPEFIDAVLDACARLDIALVVPTIDTELPAFSRAQARFAAAGVLAVIGSPALIDIARDKLATARFLAAAGLPSPRTASGSDVLEDGDGWTWPLIAKPRYGSSGVGVQLVNEPAEALMLEAREPYVIQERLEGREYTVNLFFDSQHRMKCAVPHERLKVRGGEVEKGVTVREPALGELAGILGSRLEGPRGALCFQAFVSEEGRPSIFEINARFGGGYPLAHQAGATFTRWLLEERLNLPATASDTWRADVVMLRYDDAVFV